MLAALTFAVACLLPLPAPQDPPSPALDVIELKNGDSITGRITTELDGYLELELEAGATLGLSKAQIAAVRRGAAPVPAASALVAPRAEWFVLHDATGQAIGWLQTSLTQRADGSHTLTEEYEFQQGTRRYQVTAQAAADAHGIPVRCYYRERISEPILASLRLPVADAAAAHERIVDERIVEATVRGDRLVVQHLDRAGRRERSLGWPEGASFPLLARAVTRASGRSTGPCTLFDPANEELVVRTYDGSRTRAVVFAGRTIQVREVAETTPTGRNAEWLDASARTLRRELAGPALVAVASSAGSARLAVGARPIAGAIAAETGGTFGLWVPNPAWVVRDVPGPGQVALANDAHGASVSLTRLDHLEPATPLAAAADAVANWFLLLQPELAVRGRETVPVRDRSAIRLLATGRRADGPTRAWIDVIPHHGHFLVLACIAPERAWEELADDFAFLARSVELDAQSLAPKLQGPLAARAGKGGGKSKGNGTKPPVGPWDVVPGRAARRPATGKPPSPVPAPAPRREAPTVRVPDDD